MNKSRKALVVIDMQEAFFKDAELTSKRRKLVNKCNKLAHAARQAGAPIFTIRTVHRRDKSTWSLNMLDDDQGLAFEGDDEAQYIAELDREGAVDIIKTRDSAFWQTELLDSLHELHINTVVLCGISTHLCITHSAVDAYSANIRVQLAVDAIATHKPSRHESFLSFLHDEYRIPLLHSSEILWQ